MAKQLPPEMAENELMARSVMDEPRTGFQKLRDLLVGRTLAEQASTALTTPLGSAQIARIAPQIGDPTLIARALRAMGREAMNYMRKTGQRITVAPRNVPGELGSHTRLGRSHVVTLGPKAQEATARHEIAGHVFEESLPYQAARDFLDAQEGLPNKLTKLTMRRTYKADEIPGEAFAYTREPMGAPGAASVSTREREYGNRIARYARKDLRDVMRKAAEKDQPLEGSLKKEFHTRRSPGYERLREE